MVIWALDWILLQAMVSLKNCKYLVLVYRDSYWPHWLVIVSKLGQTLLFSIWLSVALKRWGSEFQTFVVRTVQKYFKDVILQKPHLKILMASHCIIDLLFGRPWNLVFLKEDFRLPENGIFIQIFRPWSKKCTKKSNLFIKIQIAL